MLSRASASDIGLAHLEGAILDSIGKSLWRTKDIASTLGIYPQIRGGSGRVGTRIVLAVLEALEEKARVERESGFWRLTQKECYRRKL